jgi:hypothetical protein
VAALFETLRVRRGPDDPISAARGTLKSEHSSADLRTQARKDEAQAEGRRRRDA